MRTVTSIAFFLTIITVPLLASARETLPVNESGFWFGHGDGMEVVWEPGVNLGYTEESPKIHPHMTARVRTMDQAVIKIGKRSYIAYGWDITSPMMIVGDDGIIIIDPPMAMEAGEETLAAFRRITDKPVKAIIYTHNHIDHVAAVRAFTTPEDVAAGKVEIYAHENLVDAVIGWASTVGPIEGRRTSFTAGTGVPKGPEGPVHTGLGPEARVGEVTFIPPSTTYSDMLKVNVAGVEMELHYVPSETNDTTVIWFPEEKILNSAEVMQGENFPNLHTIRGTRFRDPVPWFKGIDKMREFPAEYLVPTHGRPIAGADNVQNMLTAYRDAIQYVNDQTIRHMNKGLTPDELVEVVKLPPHLAEHPWLNEDYGSVKHSVRQIYVGHLGWFQGDPWALDPLPPMERAKRYVELMGGREAVMSAAQKAVDDGEYTWAAEILTNVIRVNKDDMEARKLKADAYRGWSAHLTNINWRNWSLMAAAELDASRDISRGFAFTSQDVIQTFPTSTLIEMLTTRIDPEKSGSTNMTLGIRLPDVNEGYGLEIRRGVVQFYEKVPENSDVILVADRAYLNRMIVGDINITGEMSQAIAEGAPPGQVAMMAAIDEGKIKVEGGSKADVKEFFSYFDAPVDVGSIKLIVR